MGRRGPKPGPNSRPAANRAAAQPVTSDALLLTTVPPCPQHLQNEAAEAWARFAPLAYETGRLTAADLPALELLCVTWAEYLAASEIADDPDRCYVVSEKGGVYAHPAVNRQSSTRKAIYTLFARFGLTPLDRSQIPGLKTATSAGASLAGFAAERNGKAK